MHDLGSNQVARVVKWRLVQDSWLLRQGGWMHRQGNRLSELLKRLTLALAAIHTLPSSLTVAMTRTTYPFDLACIEGHIVDGIARGARRADLCRAHRSVRASDLLRRLLYYYVAGVVSSVLGIGYNVPRSWSWHAVMSLLCGIAATGVDRRGIPFGLIGRRDRRVGRLPCRVACGHLGSSHSAVCAPRIPPLEADPPAGESAGARRPARHRGRAAGDVW